MERQRGITLVELVATVAMLAILAGLGAPAFASLRARLGVVAAASELTGALAFARLSAVARNEAVTICPSIDGRRCSGTTDWSPGWLVYADGARSDQPTSAADVLRTGGALPTGLSTRSTGGRRRVRFQPGGWASGANTTFRICHAHGAGRRVIVNNSGRARSDADARCPQA